MFSILQSGLQSDSQGKCGIGLRNRDRCLGSRAGFDRCGARSSPVITFQPSFLEGEHSESPLHAVAKNPKILLCDEPTGALDYQTGEASLENSPRHVSSKRNDGDYRDPQWRASPIADRVIHMRDATVKT